jgi:hypothetical protein
MIVGLIEDGKLCRSVCGDARLAIPAACVAARTARWSCRVDIGVDGVEPREQLSSWARDPPPIARQFQQLRREHDKAILVALEETDKIDARRTAGPSPSRS